MWAIWLVKFQSKYDDFREMELELISILCFSSFSCKLLWTLSPVLLCTMLEVRHYPDRFQDRKSEYNSTEYMTTLYQSLLVVPRTWALLLVFCCLCDRSRKLNKSVSSPSSSPVIPIHLKHNKPFSLLQGRLGCTGICPQNTHTHTIQHIIISLSCHSI